MKEQKPLQVCMFAIVCSILLSCKTSHTTQTVHQDRYPSFFKIGHRGTRGLMPENTIPAMKKGIEVGANTIELDVHISKDGKVIVYHDESFNPDYTVMPDGSEIPKQERKKYTFYQMGYAQIRSFIIGTKKYAPFPHQQQIFSYTPLLTELIDSVDAFTRTQHLPDVYYLVEIKSNEKTDGYNQPAPEEFVKTLMAALEPKQLGNRLIIQSFDKRPLQVLHRLYPDVALGFLTGDNNASFEEHLNQLGFLPAFYNPNEQLVDTALIRQCHAKNIRITPWTVNEVATMKKFKEMGVDGIITDYPNLLKEIE